MNRHDYVPRNTATTLLLAQVLLALPIDWVLAAPVAKVRALAHSQARTLRTLWAASMLDTDGHTATEALLMLEDRMRGATGTFRDELVYALGYIAVEVADRIVNDVQTATSIWAAVPGHAADCDRFGLCDPNCPTEATGVAA